MATKVSNNQNQLRLNDNNAQTQGPAVRDLMKQLKQLIEQPKAEDQTDPNKQAKSGGCSGGGCSKGGGGQQASAAGSTNPLMEALLEAQKRQQMEALMKQMRDFSPKQIANALRDNPGMAQQMGQQMGIDPTGGASSGGFDTMTGGGMGATG